MHISAFGSLKIHIQRAERVHMRIPFGRRMLPSGPRLTRVTYVTETDSDL